MNKTVCNPMNLNYRFAQTDQFGKRVIHREAADPSIVLYRGRYYLFPSMSAGFWHSDDLAAWTFQKNTKLPYYDYAPDVREINGMLYFCASRRKESCPIYRVNDPLTDEFEEVSRPFAFWDPHLFQDDNGRVYLYWGCSALSPLYGIELNRQTLLPIGEKAPLIYGNKEQHGWERVGEDNDPKRLRGKIAKVFSWVTKGQPFIEGAWMTKYMGKYYLQYAAPAAEYNAYADGVYIGDSPLGPFIYCDNSPFSCKQGGFITGAGHGSTFQDKHGNWWHTATMHISLNHSMERRLGLFPAGFDEDGTLFCNQNFADYPMTVPDGKFDPWKDAFPAWMLLSYKKRGIASSTLPGHGAELALNEDILTCWAANSTNPGEHYTVDLGEICSVRAIQINLADYMVEAQRIPKSQFCGELTGKRFIYTEDFVAKLVIEGSADGVDWQLIKDGRGAGECLPHDFITLEEEKSLRYVRVTAWNLPFNARFAMSGLRVFGKGKGTPPPPTTATVKRIGSLNMLVSWEKSTGAQGYNVRYGASPDKLYHSHLVYEQMDLNIGTLTEGISYYVCVDAFNENGITEGCCVSEAQ